MNKLSENYPISPMQDLVFAKIFENSDAAEAALGLVNAVLRNAGYPAVREIVEVKSQYTLIGTLIEEEEQGKNRFSHGGRVDVRARAEDGTLFGIEMQLYDDPVIVDRSLVYDGLLVRDAFAEGNRYDQLPRRVLINILAKGIRKDPTEYHNVIAPAYLNGRTCGEAVTDRLRIHCIEMDVFEKIYGSVPTEELPELGVWLRYLSKGYKSREEEQKMIGTASQLEAFAKRYHIAADDPSLREKYEFLMDQISLEATRMGIATDEAKKKGMEEGRAEGQEKGQEKINRLNRALIRDERFADLKRGTEDKAYQEQLLKEYGIE